MKISSEKIKFEAEELLMKLKFLFLILSMLLISCGGRNEKITAVSQINGKKICVLTGSAGDVTARAKFPASTFMDFAGSSDAALAVKTGKADVFVYDKSVLIKIVEKISELVILDEPVAQLDVAVAVNKDNTGLLDKINQAMTELRNEGKFSKLRSKWVDSKYEHVEPVDLSTLTGDKVLKMGTCAIYEPFTFVSEGKFTGLDFDITKLIAEKLGVRIEVIDMNFDGLIPSLQSGKIDFALSNFNVTEERKKSISFSVPYISNDISVLVKK